MYQHQPPVPFLNPDARPGLGPALSKAYRQWSEANEGHTQEEGRAAHNRLYQDMVKEFPTWAEITSKEAASG